jgi:hypothetical protein
MEQTYTKKIGNTTFIVTPHFSEERTVEDIIKNAIKRDIQLLSQTEKTSGKRLD